MKGFLTLMKTVGVMIIIGTAGATDCAIITSGQALCQIGLGLAVILAAMALPFVGRFFCRIAVMLFCVR